MFLAGPRGIEPLTFPKQQQNPIVFTGVSA